MATLRGRYGRGQRDSSLDPGCRAIGLLLLATLLFAGDASAGELGSAYRTTGRCGAYPRLAVTTPEGLCVGLVAGPEDGLRMPRSIVAPTPALWAAAAVAGRVGPLPCAADEAARGLGAVRALQLVFQRFEGRAYPVAQGGEPGGGFGLLGRGGGEGGHGITHVKLWQFKIVSHFECGLSKIAKRHSGASRNPSPTVCFCCTFGCWIPACAGMTPNNGKLISK